MKKIIILIPIFNDWESLIKLIEEVNLNIKDFKNIQFDCIVINDASTINLPIIKKPSNINSIKILSMRKNQGHARCNAFGIRYVLDNTTFDNLILMDGDGEDRPVELKELVNKTLKNPNRSVVAKRVKRSEGVFFQLLYRAHKILTLIFTGKNINFGNYSCLTRKDVCKIYSRASLWSSYSGTIKKNIDDFDEINSFRGLRYFGPSQMSLLNLLIHSFSIIAVFKLQVFLRSLFLILILFFFMQLSEKFSIFLQFIIVLFNALIFGVSFRENKNELINSKYNLEKITEITQ